MVLSKYLRQRIDASELTQEWKESIIVPIHKKGDRMDCNNYRGISLLSTSYKILSNILLSRITPYDTLFILALTLSSN